jgi:poly(3-hydroxybutyrate) depolymerase
MTVQAAPCTGLSNDCTEVRLVVDNRPRMYEYHVPQGAGCPSNNLPVVMFLHGGSGSAQGARNDIGYANADRNCYLVVVPEAVIFQAGGIWNAGDCLGLPPGSGYTGPKVGDGCGYVLERADVDDVRYIGALLDDLRSRVSYDPRRVYATGFSLGGSMVHRLACEMSTRVAAAAVIEGQLKVAPCRPERPVPMQQWSALGDTSSPYAGGTGDPSTPYTASVHLQNLGLPPFASPTSTMSFNSPRVPGATDSVRVWSGNGVSYVLHTLSQQLQHTWLRNDPLAFDWREVNWQFLSQYSHGSKRRSSRH